MVDLLGGFAEGKVGEKAAVGFALGMKIRAARKAEALAALKTRLALQKAAQARAKRFEEKGKNLVTVLQESRELDKNGLEKIPQATRKLIGNSVLAPFFDLKTPQGKDVLKAYIGPDAQPVQSIIKTLEKVVGDKGLVGILANDKNFAAKFTRSPITATKDALEIQAKRNAAIAAKDKSAKAKQDLAHGKTAEARAEVKAREATAEAERKSIKFPHELAKAKQEAKPKGKAVPVFDGKNQQLLQGIEDKSGNITVNGQPLGPGQGKITEEVASKLVISGVRGAGRTTAEDTKRQKAARLLPEVINKTQVLIEKVDDATKRGVGLGGFAGSAKDMINTVTKYFANVNVFKDVAELREAFDTTRESLTKVLQADATRFSEGLRTDLKAFFELPGDAGSSNETMKFKLEALQEVVLPRFAEVMDEASPGSIRNFPPGKIIDAIRKKLLTAPQGKFLARLIDSGLNNYGSGFTSFGGGGGFAQDFSGGFGSFAGTVPGGVGIE